MKEIYINTNEKNNNKRVKRKISVFTIMLWIFLISTMITITVNSAKRTNALEIEDKNWNIELQMYDRSSDTQNEVLTDFNWYTSSETETKELTMQINYDYIARKTYSSGELVIEIPGISRDSFSEYWRNMSDSNSYSDWLKDNVVIAADKVSDNVKQYNWSYSYDEEKNIYTFMNNQKIEKNGHFEGMIQIAYNLLPRFKIQTDLKFRAKLRENIINVEEVVVKESNICKFSYRGSKISYSLKNTIKSGEVVDNEKAKNILNDYYWVRCYTYTSKVNSNINALDEYGNKIYGNEAKGLKLTLSEGEVIYDENFNKVEPKENNTYYYLDLSSNYYIGYPKSKYNAGNNVTIREELWGRYEDEENIQRLSIKNSSTTLIELKEIDLNNEYDIESSSNGNVYINERRRKGGESQWIIRSAIAKYTDSKMDVEIGDDILYINAFLSEFKDQNVVLNDDEYNFTRIDIPVFYTYNKYTGGRGEALIGYNYEIQVRYKDTEKYVVYKKGITSDREVINYVQDEIEFNRDDVVGVKIVIKDLDKTLYLKNDVAKCIRIFVDLHFSQGLRKNGLPHIYNSCYLQVYKKDKNGNRTLVNKSTEDKYGSDLRALKIPEYDINTYGNYIQRNYNSAYENDGTVNLSNRKSNKNLTNNVKEEKYELKYELESILLSNYANIDKDCIIKEYDILPEGMSLISSKKEIIDSITSTLSYENLKLKSGEIFDSKDKFEEYIKENTTVEIDNNYKGSRRTKISVIYNLSNIDWSYYLVNNIDNNNICVNIKVEILYDSILKYGTKWINNNYTMWNNQEYSYYIVENSEWITDNGSKDSLASDIDEDGNTGEYVIFNTDTLNIIHAVSSEQALITQVRTDLTKGEFVEGTAEASAGSEYTYKLKITAGVNSIKDLILYDTVETIFDESGEEIEGWKGEFIGVDTSYAVSKGYAPKVYYSEEQSPGKITEVPDKWSELTEITDKSKVKSICVDLRKKQDGSEMELPGNNIVFILLNMRAPDDKTLLTTSKNMFSANLMSSSNTEEVFSNQVNIEISKADLRKELSGIINWEDEDNKYGVRPESVIVKLLQDGQEYETKTVTAETNWNYTFENVPVYKNNTSMYEYEVVEDEVQNYEISYDGNNITNSIKLKDLEVTKIWDDDNNRAGKRPDSVILQVYDSDVLISEAEVNESTSWKHTFTNLQKYRDNGEEITYTVNEKSFDTDKFYVKEINGNSITNTFTVPEDKIKIVGTKVWNDENNRAGKRPDKITLQVKENGAVVTEQEITENDNWSYEFELAKYDSLGNEQVYTIDEKDTGNKFYKKELTNNTTVTNTFEVPNETINVEVVKIWNDNENEANKRPNSVKLQVKAGEEVVEEAVVNDTNEWKHTFTLTKYDSLGDEITYTVDEEISSEFYVKNIIGNTITNTFTVPEDKVKIVGTKVWDDLENFANKRDAQVTLQIIGDNEVVAEQVVNADNKWSIEVEVPKYDKYGNEISYYIDEKNIGNKFYQKELTNATTVTNRFEVPNEKKNIEVMNIWDDNNNESGKRPTSIKLQVKRNGVVIEEFEVNESTNWKHTFELPKYDERGDEIEYIVDEDFASEFYVKNIVGNVITNTFSVPEDKIKVAGTKVWEDNGNAGGKRNDNVILQLKNEKDEVISEAEVSDRNNWSYEFEASKYDRLGNVVNYHIDEKDTLNKFYQKEITNATTVTNKFIVPEEVILVKAVKKWEDNNDEYGKRPENVILQVFDGDKLIAEEKVSAENNWSYELKLPKYDELGDEIRYTVDEKSTSKYYEKSVEGNTIINKCIYKPVVDTSDMNIIRYAFIFFVAVIGVVCGIIFVRKDKIN